MTFDDLKEIVDTRGKACPYLLGDPCKERACAFWMRDTFGNDQGKSATLEGCMPMLQYVATRDTFSETQRFNATMDKHNQHLLGSAQRVAELMRRKINGPPPAVLEESPP